MKCQITVHLILFSIYFFKTSDTSSDYHLNKVKIPQKPKPGCECQFCPTGYKAIGNECCGGWDQDPPDTHCLPDYYCDSDKGLTRKTMAKDMKSGCENVAVPAPPPDN